MKKILPLLLVITLLICCTNNKKKETTPEDKKISLRSDTVNVVKLTDTLVIYESTCRGCAYENSTTFAVKDSMDVVKLLSVHTSDNNSPDMDGGSVGKQLIIVPVKAGSTVMKMYKFWQGVPDNITDSIPYKEAYKIEVIN
jgi:D-tyrosyl-tRNA(Tyr) deacylase